MSAIEIVVTSLEQTIALAERLAAKAELGDCFALYGDLGAGKTTFAQGFVRALLAKPEDVTSPTFNLVHSYDTKLGVRLWHMDLYRLTQVNELEALGVEDAFNFGISVIEWPELAQAVLPKNHVQLRFSLLENEARKITITSENPKWQKLLA